MLLLIRPSKQYLSAPFSLHAPKLLRRTTQRLHAQVKKERREHERSLVLVRGCQGEEKKGERRSFLSIEEAGLVEISGLSTHERFLCRLTVSSLNLLRVISEQEGCPIEELNAGRICDWFVKDKLRREQNLESAVLKWDESDFQL